MDNYLPNMAILSDNNVEYINLVVNMTLFYLLIMCIVSC